MIIDAFGQPTKQPQADSGYLSAQARRSSSGANAPKPRPRCEKEGSAKYPEFECFAPRYWSLDAILDFVVPALAVTATALIIGGVA